MCSKDHDENYAKSTTEGGGKKTLIRSRQIDILCGDTTLSQHTLLHVLHYKLS